MYWINWIKNIIKKRKMAKANKRLSKAGLEFRRTRLGQASFIPLGTTGNYARKMMLPDDWSVAELKAMAKYMEADPNCTLFSDGSGKPCK